MKKSMLFLLGILVTIFCKCTICKMPIEAFDNYSVLAIRYLNKPDIGKLIKNEKILLNGKTYKIPAGTIIDNSDLGGIIFPKVTYLPVGNNLIPFAANEWVFISYYDSVCIESGVLAYDRVFNVGYRKIPFWAARNTHESKKYRGEFQIRFHRNGTISEGFIDPKGLLLEVGQNKIQIPGKAPIEFYEDGNIRKVYIKDSTLLRVGQNIIPFFCNVCFYPSGQILSGNIKGDVTLIVGERLLHFCDTGGYYAYLGSLDMVDGNISFHENGSIKSGLLCDTTEFVLFGNYIRMEPQGIFFDSLGHVEVIVDNLIRRYKTDKPMLKFDDETIWNDTLCPEYNNEPLLEDLPDELPNDFSLKIGGNTLLFAKNQKYRHNDIMYSNIVPKQRVRIGVNELLIDKLGWVDGTRKLFYPNGAIRGVILLSDTELIVGRQKIRFIAHKNSEWADVGFYCDGTVAFGTIAHEISDSIFEFEPEYYLYKSKKVTLMPNQVVFFKRDGSVKYSMDGSSDVIREYITDVYVPKRFSTDDY